MTDQKITVSLKITSGKAKEAIEKILSFDGGFQLQKAGDSQPCDLMIVEMGNELEGEFKNISEMLTTGRVSEVFLTSSTARPEVLIWALKIGVREFIAQPINPEELRSALLRYKERREKRKVVKISQKKGKVIIFLGSKGGVGTTTVTVNLAANLVESGGKKNKEKHMVSIIDMNLLSGEVPLFLGLKSSFDWVEVMKNMSRMDATYLMGVLSKHSSGVYILPPPVRLTKENPISDFVMLPLLKLMRTMFDFIVIDGGKSLSSIPREIFRMADTVLLVTNICLPCLINLKRYLSTFREFGYPPEKDIHVVANRFQKNSLVSLKEAEESIKKKFLYCIPNDFELAMKAINQGKPLVEINPRADISKKFKGLSNVITGQNKSDNKSLFGFVKKK